MFIEWSDAAKELHNTKILIKELEEREKSLQAKLILLSRNDTAQDDNFVFERYERKGSVNYTAIPELKAINLEQYRKNPMVCWKLSRIEKLIV